MQSPYRSGIDLAGSWLFHVDPSDEGVGERLGDDPVGALLVSRLLAADTEPFTTTNSEDTP